MLSNLLKKISTIALLCLTSLCLNVQAGQYTQAFFPLTGPSTSSIKALNRTLTACAYDGSVDASGNLLNTTGVAGRDLAPTGTPTRAVSTLQGQDGNRLLGRAFVAASMQSYSIAAAAWMNIFDSDFTLTAVAGMSGAASQGTLFRHVETVGPTAGGFTVLADHVNYVTATLYKADGTTRIVTGPSININDGKHHIIQVKRVSNVVTVTVDGSAGVSVNVAGYGVDTTHLIYIGTGFGYWNGDILYTRLDAEALSDSRLAYEQQLLSGIAAGTTWGAAMDYARAGTAYQTFSDGTMALRPSGAPRVGDGVLIEGAATNLFLQSSVLDNASWTKLGTDTISANGMADETGVAVMDGVVGSASDAAHGVTQAVTLTAANYSFRFKARIGNKGWAYFADNTVADATGYVNVTLGTLGTIGAGFSNVKVTPKANGTMLVTGTVLGTADAHTWQFGPAHADGDNDFAGDAATVNAWFSGFQCEPGSFATSQIDTTTAAASRIADDLSVPPYNLRNTLVDILSPYYTLGYFLHEWLDFSQDPSGATFLDQSGNHTFTKVGQPKRYQSATYGYYHKFDGVNDYYTSPFTEGVNTSFVMVVTPDTITGTHMLACNGDGTTVNQGWILYQDGSSVVLQMHLNGFPGGDFTVTKTNALVANKPALITAVMDIMTGIYVYVDALTPAYTAVGGLVEHSNDQSLHLGANRTGGDKFAGKMHFFAYVDYYALAQADHDRMYAALKVPGILPTEIAHSTHYTKVRLKGSYICPTASYTGPLLEISGITVAGGTTDSNTNRIVVSAATTTLRASFYANGEDTERFATYTVAHNKWNDFEVLFDVGNLANSWGKVNSATANMTLDPGTMTGADKHFSALDTKFRLGQDYLGTTFATCSVKNVLIEPLP